MSTLSETFETVRGLILDVDPDFLKLAQSMSEDEWALRRVFNGVPKFPGVVFYQDKKGTPESLRDLLAEGTKIYITSDFPPHTLGQNTTITFPKLDVLMEQDIAGTKIIITDPRNLCEFPSEPLYTEKIRSGMRKSTTADPCQTCTCLSRPLDIDIS